MERRAFGPLGEVSALTLGGGGLGQVWGETTRTEAIAAVHEALDSGVTMLDVAPSYGDGEAERVVGDALGGALPDGVLISTKCRVGDTPEAEVDTLLRNSLEASLERLQLDRVDLFIVHNQIVDDADASRYAGTTRGVFTATVRPALQALVEEGRIGGWGLTAIGVPDALLATFDETPAPSAVQCIANLLDSAGGIKRFEGPLRARDLIANAAGRGIGVMGIRAVQAGALTDAFDRELPEGSPDLADYERAAPFRNLARERGESPAALAHRYALSLPGVSTVVLGVKNREELRECVEAEARGPLAAELMAGIEAGVA
jgi:aryl-alcohol dehydrogenase-like predicted oxidoreductase